MRATARGHTQLYPAHPWIQESIGTRPLYRPLGLPALSGSDSEAMDKYDKIYKVRPMLDRMLPLFHHYYSPCQQLSLDEGMILTKNHLPIKQYIRDKQVRCGIKSFLLCEAKTGYILNAGIYTGQVKDCHWPLLGLAGSVVCHIVKNWQVANKNHMLFMYRFYNSVTLFHLLKMNWESWQRAPSGSTSRPLPAVTGNNLCQVQQLSEETPSHRIRKHAP